MSNNLWKGGIFMKYEKPEVTVFTQEEIDNIIGASACGSNVGSCYAGCNGDGCTFTVGSGS